MNEPKDIAPDLPEEEEPFDAPPAPPADPAPEEASPDLPAEEPEPWDEPEEPVEDAAPAPEPEPAPERKSGLEAAIAEIEAYDVEADLFEDQPEPESVEPAELEAAPVDEAEPEPAPVVEIVEAPAPLAARPAPTPVEADLHGPEPWDDAPAADWKPLRQVEPEPEAVAETAAAPAVGPASPQAGEATYEVKRSPFAVYLAYLTALMGVGLPALPFACWWAYKQRRDAPAWLKSHYTFQIRTFWIVMAGLGAAVLVLFLPFGLFPLTIVATAVWLVMRCFVGMVRLHRGEPIFHPQTWTV